MNSLKIDIINMNRQLRNAHSGLTKDPRVLNRPLNKYTANVSITLCNNLLLNNHFVRTQRLARDRLRQHRTPHRQPRRQVTLAQVARTPRHIDGAPSHLLNLNNIDGNVLRNQRPHLLRLSGLQSEKE